MTDNRLTRAKELSAIADKLGISITELGRRIGVESGNFRRMARTGDSGREAPDGVMIAARRLIDDRSADAIDAIIVGAGDATGDRYVIRTTKPRCIAYMAARDKIGRIIWQDKPTNAAALEAEIIEASVRAYHRAYHADGS